MQFTSLLFLCFFVAVFLLYWALPHRFRWVAALAASAVFYSMLGLPAVCVLAGCIFASYWMGLWLCKAGASSTAPEENKTIKSIPAEFRLRLAFCVVLALTPLLTFKYFDSVSALLGYNTTISIFTPLGVSFFTFKIVAYLVEVWRGRLPAQRHLGKYALYVSFFPEVFSGPIQRPADLLRQIDTPQKFDEVRALRGAQLALWGFFKKLVLADNLAYYVGNGFNDPSLVTGPSVILAVVLYSVQLYCDFSGYSDIAIGCMNTLGYEVPENFRSPYFAKSLHEFWDRWHISLSTWLRDYVYYPLGGSKCSTGRTCLNLILTFFISGLWHGTGLQFVAWGLLHGAYQVIGRLTANLRHRAWQLAHISEQSAFAGVVKTVCTFVLVAAAWVLFGATSLQHAGIIFEHMPDGFGFGLTTWVSAFEMLGFNCSMLLRLGVAGALLLSVDWFSRECGFTVWLSARKKWMQVALCYVLVFFIAFFSPVGGGSFIYFKF